MKTCYRNMPLQASKLRPMLHTGFAILAIIVFSSAAQADPPAKTATCEGIKEAYPVLGTKCENTYALVKHDPSNAGERKQSYTARKTVLQIFQKALLCNGMYGAKGPDQDRFKKDEYGHLEALKQLQQSMTKAGDRNIPAQYTAAILKDDVKMKMQQCK